MASVDSASADQAFRRRDRGRRSRNLTIADGEFLTLLGPSGCGKSTALACIAGLERRARERSRSTDADVTELERPSATSRMVFQDYALYPHMTVRDNMSFGLRQQRLEATTITRQVAAAAEMLGLGPLLERRPAELSAAASGSASRSAARWCAIPPCS